MIRAIANYIAWAALTAGASWAQVTTGCTPTSLPVVIGTAADVTCNPSGGTAPYSWTISVGALPPGLTQNPSTGEITGKLADPAGPYNFTVFVTDGSTPANTGSQAYTGTTIDPLSVSCTPTAGPVEVGIPYTDSCTPTGGTPPYTWNIIGTAIPLCSGVPMTISSAGVINCTPSAAGSYVYRALVVDVSVPTMEAYQQFTGTIAPAVMITTPSPLPPGQVGVAYSVTLAASPGVPPYMWSSSGLPSALTLNPSTGVLSGTPTAAGPLSFGLSVMDAAGGASSGTFSLTVNPKLTITNTSPLPAAMVGAAYSDTFAATGGSGGYTWAVTSGTLPTGLTLTAAGVLSGTAASAGAANFTVTVTDSSSETASGSFALTVNPKLVITNTSPLPAATVDSAYSDTFAATGGTGSGYTWAVTSGTLPAGLTLSSAGLLSGTPTAAGPSSFTVTVTDSGSETQSGVFSLTVNGLPALTITTSSPLANGIVGVAYNQTLSGTGGLTPYTWSVTSGALPAGLTLNTSSGQISGTPVAPPGTATFTIELKDSETPAVTTSKAFSITISTGLTITTTSLPNATAGFAYAQTLSAAGGTTPYTWSITTGALPSGLTLGATSGAITGTPSATGTASFTVEVTDATGATATPAKLAIDVVPAPSITTNSPLPNATAGLIYSQTLAATGGTPPYKWSVSSGTLPAGLSLSTSGAITGTPLVAGSNSFTVQLTDNLNATASKAFSLTVISTLTISTSPTLPAGEAGVSYAGAGLAATGGAPPYTWSVTAGALPTGMTLTAAGSVSGTPSESGTYNFTAQVTDSNKVTDSAAFSLTIAPALQISNASALTGGSLGAPYSQTLTATGGVTPYTWALTAGALPTPLVLASNGAITGTPNKTGTFTFTATVTDALKGSASRQFTMIITAGLSVSTPALPVATVGTPYSQTLTASGGTAPYTWAVTVGSLPSGLSLSPGGSISGNPSMAGSATFTVQVTDSLGSQASAQFTITVAPALGITTSSLPGASLGVAYSQKLAAAGGTPPYTWSVINGALPGGLTLSTAGTISGTPNAAGAFSFTVQATDSASATASQKLSITVAAGLSITTSATLPGATLNTSYSETLAAAGGAPPYQWALTAGTLPTGLTLSTAGAISGTPTATGTFTFTAKVTDSAAATASLQFTIVVASSGPSFTTTSLPGGKVGTAYSQTLAVSGGTPPYTFAKTDGSLPPGITLAGGTLSGTPSDTGSYSFTIEVTDNASATASQQFTIVITGLAITSGATLPSAALGTAYSATVVAAGTAPYAFSVTAGKLPGGLTLNASSGSISGTPSATGDFDFTIQVTDSTKASASQAFSMAVLSASFGGISGTAESGQQVSGTVALGTTYKEAVSVQIALSFTPDPTLAAPSGDPAIQFSSGGTAMTATVAAGSTTPVPFALQTGTVAGTITLTVNLQAGSAAVLPAVVTQTIQIAKAAPVISAVSVASTSSGFTVSVTAYSNTRDLSQAVVQFTPASGQTLETTSVTVSLTSAASSWFQSSGSDQYGGNFILTLPFTVAGGAATDIGSVSVVLQNSVGSSTAANGDF